MSDRTGDRVEGAVDSLKGTAKEGFGRATGDERTEAEGQLDQLKGDAKQTLADVKEGVSDVVKKVTDKTR